MDGRSGGANHSNDSDGAPPARHPPTTVNARQSRHVKCSAWKVINIDAKSFVYRFDGDCKEQPKYTIYTVNDPRKQYIRFRKTEPADLPVPIFVLDNNTVGLPPKREVSIYGLNDNINEAFLRDMCEKIGSISEITIYRHPRTKKHMGMALVVFSEPKLAELFVAKNDGCSVMGGVITCFLDPYASKISKRYEQLGMECAPIPEYLKNISDSKINELRRSLNTPHSPHETPYHDDGPSCSGIDRVEETLEQFFDSMPSRSPCESTTPRAAIETPSCSTFVRSTTPTTPPPSKKITHNKNHKNNINNAISKNISSNADKENSDFVNNTSKPPKLLFAESGCSITKTPGTPQSDLVSDVRGRCPLPPEPPSSTSTTTIPPLSRAPFPVHAPPSAPAPSSVPVSLVPPNGAPPLLPPPPFFLSTPTPHMPPSPLPFCSSPLINQHPPPQNAFYPILPSPAPHLVTPSLISSAASLPMKATDYVPPPPPPPSDSVLKSFSVTNLSTLPPPQPPHSIATSASHPDASGYRIVKTPTTPEEPPPMDPMPFEQSNTRERKDVKNVSSSSKKDANKFRKEGLNNRVEKLRHLTDDSKTQHKRRHATCSPSTVSSSEDQKESGSEQEDVSEEEDGEDPESDLSTTAFQRKTKNEHRSSRKRHHAEAIVEEKRKYYKRKNYAEGSKDYYKEVVIRTLDEVKDRKETNTSRCHGDSRELVQEVERYQRIRRYKRRRSEDELRGSLSPEEVVRQSRKNPLETDDIDLPDLKSISSDEDDTEETRNDSRNENGTDSNYQKRKYGGSTRYDDRARLRTPTQQQSDRNRRSGMGFSTAPQRSSSFNCTRLATTGNSASGLDRRDRILSDRRIPSFFEIDVSLPPQSQSNRRKTMAVSSTAGGCASSIDRRRGHRWSSTSASDDSFSDTDESVARSRRSRASKRMAKRRHKKIRVDENDDCTSSTKRNRSSKKVNLMDLKDMMEEISDSTNDSSDPKGTAIGCNKATKLGDQSHSKTIGQTATIATNNPNEQSLSAQQQRSSFEQRLETLFHTNSAANQSLESVCKESPQTPSIGTPASVFTPVMCDSSPAVTPNYVDQSTNVASRRAEKINNAAVETCSTPQGHLTGGSTHFNATNLSKPASMDTVSKIDRSRSKEAEEDAERRRKEEQAKILEAIERERDRFEQEKKLAEEREARRREHERKLEIQKKRAIRGKCVDKMFERLYTDLSAVLVKDALRKMELLVVEKLEVSWAKSLEEQNEKVKDENKGTTTAESGKAVLKGPRTPPEKSVLTPSSKNSLNEMVRKVAAQSKAEMSAAFGPEAAGMLGADFLFQGFGAIRNMPSFKKKVVKPAVTSSLSSKRDKSNDSSRRSRRERSGSVSSSRRSDADSSGSSSRNSSSSSSATTSRSTTPARSESASRASLRDTELEKQKNRASKSLKQRSNRDTEVSRTARKDRVDSAPKVDSRSRSRSNSASRSRSGSRSSCHSSVRAFRSRSASPAVAALLRKRGSLSSLYTAESESELERDEHHDGLGSHSEGARSDASEAEMGSGSEDEEGSIGTGQASGVPSELSSTKTAFDDDKSQSLDIECFAQKLVLEEAESLRKSSSAPSVAEVETQPSNAISRSASAMGVETASSVIDDNEEAAKLAAKKASTMVNATTMQAQVQNLSLSSQSLPTATCTKPSTSHSPTTLLTAAQKKATVRRRRINNELAQLLPPPVDVSRLNDSDYEDNRLKGVSSFEARSEEQEFDVFIKYQKDGFDREDLKYLEKAFHDMQNDGTANWNRILLWVPPCEIPTVKLLAKPRKVGKTEIFFDDPELNGVMPHSTGCARTQGYYKLSNKQKRGIIRRPEGFQDRTEISERDEKTVRHVVQATREARSDNRRLLTSIGETSSDILKVNQLKYRKKMIKFARSRIHGWGLYALELIGPDEMIVEYVGQKIRPTVADEREKKYMRKGMGSSYLFRIDSDNVIDATNMGNFARFINHSCQPNCYAKVVVVDGEKRIVIYSKTQIEKGDEITYDYKFPIEDDDKIDCLCGAPQCRGTLN